MKKKNKKNNNNNSSSKVDNNTTTKNSTTTIITTINTTATTTTKTTATIPTTTINNNTNNDDEEKYLLLLKSINDKIELAMLEKDVYDKVKNDILSLNNIENDIKMKLNILAEIANNKEQNDNNINKEIMNMNTKMNDFKTISQQVDLTYIENIETMNTLSNDVNINNNDIKALDDKLLQLKHQNSELLKVIKNHDNDKIKMKDLENKLDKQNESYYSNVNLLESMMNAIEKKEDENMTSSIKLNTATQLYSTI